MTRPDFEEDKRSVSYRADGTAPIGLGLIALAEAIVYAANRLAPRPSDPVLGPVKSDAYEYGRLCGLADSLDVQPEWLDEAVHDAFGSSAADINNQGISEQIRFLMERLGVKGAEKAILAAKNEEIDNG
jgi:hypothetical protein